MKQENLGATPGIPALQGGEDVKAVPVSMHGTIHDAVIADVRARQVQGEREYGRWRKRVERREVLVEIEDEMPPPAFFDERDLAAIARYEDDPST